MEPLQHPQRADAYGAVEATTSSASGCSTAISPRRFFEAVLVLAQAGARLMNREHHTPPPARPCVVLLSNFQSCEPSNRLRLLACGKAEPSPRSFPRSASALVSPPDAVHAPSKAQASSRELDRRSFFMGCYRAAAPRPAITGLWINSQPSAGRSVGLTSWRQRGTYDGPTV